MPGWEAEDAEDSALVDYTYLNMCFVVESCTFEELFTFYKQGPDRLIGQDRGV